MLSFESLAYLTRPYTSTLSLRDLNLICISFDLFVWSLAIWIKIDIQKKEKKYYSHM